MVDTVRKRFGLLGRNISYSQRLFFTDKLIAKTLLVVRMKILIFSKLMPLQR
jgi:hypothetical protein